MRFHRCDDEPDELCVGHARHISVAGHVVRGNDVQQPWAVEGGQLLPKNVEIALADLEWIENRLRLRYHALNDHAARGGPIGHGLVDYRDADSERFSCAGQRALEIHMGQTGCPVNKVLALGLP